MPRQGLRASLRPRSARVRHHQLEALESRIVLFNAAGGVWPNPQSLTFGFMATGIADSANLDGGWQNTALVEHAGLPADIEAQFASAARGWARVANLSLNRVTDGGEAFGATPSAAVIRVGSHAIDGAGGALYKAFGPPPVADSQAGDIQIDLNETFAASPALLFNTLTQAVGVALGLGMDNSLPSVMNTEVPTTPLGPQIDDVRGIQWLYGPSVALELPLSAGDDPTAGNQAGDGSPDVFRIVRRTEAITPTVGGSAASRSVDVVDMYVNGALVRSVNHATLQVLTISGSSDADTLIVDFSGGNPLPSTRLQFDAGNNNLVSDSVQLVGTGNANVITYRTENTGSMTLLIDNTRMVLNGVEPIMDGLTSTERRFEAPNLGVQEFHLLGDGTSGNNMVVMTGTGLGYSSATFRLPSELMRVEAGPSDDLLFFESLQESFVTPIEMLGDAGNDRFLARPNANLPMHLVGGGQDGSPGDVLALDLTGVGVNVVPDAAATDGLVTALGYGSVEFTGMELVITPDRYEPNDVADAGTNLGSALTVALTNLTIHDDDDLHAHADIDVFNYTAHETGSLSIAALFTNTVGDLNLEVRTSAGQVLASSATTGNVERVVIPAVAQQTYQIVVSPAAAGANVNHYSLEIENFALPQPDLVTLAASSDTGLSSQDGVTFDTRPRIVVQAGIHELNRGGVVNILSPENATLGTVPGAAIQVFITNLATGAQLSGFARQLPEDGSGPVSDKFFAFTPPTPLVEGNYAITAAWRVWTGVVGGSSLGPLAEPLSVTVDTTAPGNSTGLDLLASSDTGALDSDNITSMRQPVLAGAAPAGTRVNLFANGILVGNTVANSNGTWQVQTVVLDDATYTFTVTVQDAAGNTTTSADSLIVEIDSIAPNTPYLDLIEDSDRGFREDDNITNDDTLTFSMTTEDPNSASHINEFNYRFRIFLRAEDAALGITGEEVLIYDSSTDLSIPLDDRQSGYTRSELLQRTLSALPDGMHNFKLEVEDRAGNVSADYLLNVKVDTADPPAALDLAAASDSGASNTDNVTRVNTPTFTGVSRAGSRVRLFADGIQVAQGTVGADATNNVLLDGLGLWQITSSAIADGVHSFVVRIETEAGNGADSAALQVEIDTAAPNLPLLDLLASSDLGVRNDDNITSDDSPAVTMTSLDVGDVHLSAFNYQFKLFLRPEDASANVSGEERLIYDSSTDVSIAAADRLDGLIRENFLSRALASLPDGSHNLKLEVLDRAGNISLPFLLPITINTAAPPATVDLLDSSDTGTSFTDNVTRLSETSYGGISTVGAKVVLFANGVLVGETTVGTDGTDANPADGLGTWRINASPLNDGRYDIRARVETPSGVSAESAVLRVEIDSVVPNTPYLDLVTASDTGVDQYDNKTTDRTPTFTMTTEDPNQANHLSQFNYIYRLFVRSEASATNDGRERLIYDSSSDATIPAANLDGLLTNLEVLQKTMADVGVGMHNFKLEVQDRAGNISDDFLLNVLVLDSGALGVITIDLVDASDSGMNNQDNVTNIRTPTFSGVAPLGAEVFLLADGQLIGKGFVAGDDSDGVLGNGQGTWFAATEALDDGVYSVVARAENLAGSVSNSTPLTVEIDTLAPNTPALDLTAASDSGRHDADNITNDTTLTVTMTTEDRVADEPHLFAQNFKFRLFARPEATSVGVTGEEVLVYDSAVDATIPAANLLDSFTNLAFLERTLGALPHGVHNFKLEVEDRAGNISADFLLTIEIDTQAPTGTIELDPNSDSGVTGVLATLSDRITRDTTPTIQGATEADGVVRITIDGVSIGTAVALPWDGNDAFPPPAGFSANFKLESGISLSDGAHTVQLFVEDRAGNGRTTPAATLEIFVDTQGPRVTNVVMGRVSQDGVFSVDGVSSLFAPKPAAGPDDLISSIVISFRDAPARTAGFLYDAFAQGLASNVGMFSVVGDAHGRIPILQAIPTFTTVAGAPAVARVELVFHDPVDGILFNADDRGAPLPDDRFTLTISESLADPAGNLVDGESNASAPFEGNDGDLATAPNLPSGNGVPGGGFTARFTVDSRPEVGVWAAGSVWVDLNGNFVFDPQNVDASHRDVVYKTGFTSDDIFAGNFRSPTAATADGFDKLAAYGRYAGKFRWIIDLNHDGAADLNIVDPANINGLPVAGNFGGTRADGDEVGLFTGTKWYFDTNGDFQVDMSLETSMRGYPIVGDFDRDGFDDLGTWADDTFRIDLARGTQRGWDGVADSTFRFGFIGVRERPVAADMDADGFDDLGLWVPDREGVAPREASEWYILVSGGASVLSRIEPALNPIRGLPEVRFSPVPFGDDLFAQFGDQFALPLLGNFDPPVTATPAVVPVGHTNPDNPLDVNNDKFVSAMDALLIINDLNAKGARELTEAGTTSKYLDANGDGFLSAIDALLVINHLNAESAAVAKQASAQAPVLVESKVASSSLTVPASELSESTQQPTANAIPAAISSAVPEAPRTWDAIAQDRTNRRRDRSRVAAVDALFSQVDR